MNREQAREAAAVMLAWADGKEVVCKARFKIGDWDSLLTNPVWNWSDFIYKVKDEAKLRPAGEMLRAVQGWGRPVRLSQAGASRFWLRSQERLDQFSTAEAPANRKLDEQEAWRKAKEVKP